MLPWNLISQNKRHREKSDNEKQFLSFSNFIRDTIKDSSEYIVNEFIGEISQDQQYLFRDHG